MKENLRREEVLKNTKQIYVFIGPEGSGKTDTARDLAKETGLPYISTGDILRDLATRDFETKYGEMCRKMFAESVYLDGDTLLEILVGRLSSEDTSRGFVLDGGMRTVEETEKFHLVLEMAGRGALPVKVLQLSIPESVSFERLLGDAGRNRPGDTPEGVAKRLASYYHLLDERLALIMERDNWQLELVDANVSPQEVVYERVVDVILAGEIR